MSSSSNIWQSISNTGLKNDPKCSGQDKIKLIFFNQVLFFGLFATLFQVFLAFPFIGYKALIFLIIPAVSLICLYLNHNVHACISKRVFTAVIYIVAVWTTILLGGDGLYHLGVFSVFAANLILYDFKTEKIDLIVGIPIVVLIIAIGELRLFNAPDFSQHELIQLLRVANLTSLIVVNSILTFFVIRLNNKNEKALEKGKDELESQVVERTLELSIQKDELVTKNREKEILLKEVHHRVKNNLQIIVSLMNLQLSNNNNEVVKTALKETQGRVLSMSIVHKKMYQSSSFSEISLEEYLVQLIDNINDLYLDKQAAYSLKIDENLAFEVDIAIPLGLIFNEIVTNFYKHVVKSTAEDSHFCIELQEKNDTTLVLKYSDNGPGFPENFKGNDTGSLGLQLISSLCEQIDAECNYSSDNGAIYEISLKR